MRSFGKPILTHYLSDITHAHDAWRTTLISFLCGGSTNDAVEDTAESAPAKTADSKADGPEPPPSKTQKTSDGGDGGRNGAPIVGEADPPAKDDSTPSTKPTATAAMGGGVEAGGDGSSSARGKGAGARVAEESTTLPDVEGIPNETLFVGNLSYK